MISLYIGNLPPNVGNEELKEILHSYGKIIDVKVIQDHETRRSKGFGFVTATEEEGLKILTKLNGQHIGKKRIIVRKAQNKKRADSKLFISKEWLEKAEYKL